MDRSEQMITTEGGGSKASKSAQFTRIPPDVLWEFAEHWGRGAEKYPDINGRGNWTYVSDLRLFRDAMQRHINLYEQGETHDPETGTHHLLCAAWHCFALVAHELHPEWHIAEDPGVKRLIMDGLLAPATTYDDIPPRPPSKG